MNKISQIPSRCFFEIVKREIEALPCLPQDEWHAILRKMPNKDLRKLTGANLGLKNVPC